MVIKLNKVTLIKEETMYKTMVTFRFWCEHENEEIKYLNATQIRDACLKQMKKISDQDVIGSTEIEFDTTEEN